MSRLLEAGWEACAEGLARAIAGGLLRTYDGDGELLCETDLGPEPEVRGRTVRCAGVAPARVVRRGAPASFEVFRRGSARPLLVGSYAASEGEAELTGDGGGVLHVGQELGVEEFVYRIGAPEGA